jgi:hypothetical protein
MYIYCQGIRNINGCVQHESKQDMKIFFFVIIEKKTHFSCKPIRSQSRYRQASIDHKYSGLELAARKRYNQSLMHLHIHAQVSYVCGHTGTAVSSPIINRPSSSYAAQTRLLFVGQSEFGRRGMVQQGKCKSAHTTTHKEQQA